MFILRFRKAKILDFVCTRIGILTAVVILEILINMKEWSMNYLL